jgi:hypothetical protein
MTWRLIQCLREKGRITICAPLVRTLLVVDLASAAQHSPALSDAGNNRGGRGSSERKPIAGTSTHG